MEKIPVELVSHIIELLVEDYGFRGGSEMYHSTLFDISLVCHAWYHIVISNPRIWSSICVSTRRPQEALVQKSLARSKAAPLNVFINLCSDAESPFEDRSDIPLALRSIQPYQHRFRTLDFYVDFRENLRDAFTILRPYFPKLERMHCMIHVNAYDGILLSMPSVEFLALRELRLFNVPIGWKSLNAPNLRKLSLELHPNPLHLDSFLHLLSSTPYIEHLEICSPNILDYTTSIHQLDLPHLKVLKIRHGRLGDLAHALLLHINALNLRVLYVSYHLKPAHEIKFTNYFAHLEHLSLVWINQPRHLLPRLASQMPNLRSFMLVACHDLPPLALGFLSQRQENGQLPFPHLTTLILRRVKFRQVMKLARSRSTLKELVLFPIDLYTLPPTDCWRERQWMWLRETFKVRLFFSRMETYERENASREFLIKGDLVWPDFRGCEIVCIEEYLEDMYGIKT